METRQEFTRARTLGAVYSESVGEYALPDYNTDIKKILLTDAHAVPSGVFSGGDTVDCAGIVNYKMVYLDGENNVTHLEFCTDYDFAVRCDAEKYIDATVDTRVSNFNIRLLGPRKIMAKATLESDMCITEREELVVMGDATEGCEVATERVLVRRAARHTLGEREYAEPLATIEGALEDEIEVLYIDAAPTSLAVVSEGEGNILVGKLHLRALVKNADSAPTLLERDIDIRESVGEECVIDPSGARADAAVTSLTATVNAEEDGVTLIASLICEYRLSASDNCEIEVVTDGYRTDSEVDNEYSDFYYTALLDTVRLEEEIRGELSRESVGCERTASVPCATATARNITASVEGDRLRLSGEIRFSGVACEENEAGEPTYTALRLDLPFEKWVNLSCRHSGAARAECAVNVLCADVELDADTVYPRATVCAYISLVEDRRITRLAVSNKRGERLEGENCRVHVVFPSSSDTLFEIAKRYHTTVAHVAAVNALTEECVSTSAHPSSLSGIKRLIIK